MQVSYWANYGLSLNITPVTNPAMWRIAFGLQLIPGVLFLILMLPQRESPRWLIEKGRIEEARKIMAYFRQVPEDDPQLELTVREIVEDVRGKEKLPMWTLLKMSFENCTVFYRCWIGIILMFWQQWCGTNSINYYSPEIFEALGLSGANAGLFATGVYGIVKVICTGTGLMLCTEQLGRKRCMIYFGLMQAFAMFFIGAYMKIHPSGPPIPASYAAIVMVYIYVVGYSFGWGTIPWVVAAEAVPNHLRTLSMSGALMTQWLHNFIIAQITPTMLATIKFGTFFVFGSCCVAMVLTAYFGVPETRGIPLEEIHAVFEGNVFKRSVADAPGGPAICRALGWGVQRSAAVAPLSARSDDSSTADGEAEKRADVTVESVA
ncbi:MFS general substrate transporter [Calocera cornea HHB12733]|uniref:MFS general substrate transporter n=1 Tax=Calocera cornea HHB12733 TaxID=1353952 RepID=A0A165HPE6_9BASI|nr:MFS general substrate transporter [Calocera cornea HHB12733]